MSEEECNRPWFHLSSSLKNSGEQNICVIFPQHLAIAIPVNQGTHGLPFWCAYVLERLEIG